MSSESDSEPHESDENFDDWSFPAPPPNPLDVHFAQQLSEAESRRRHRKMDEFMEEYTTDDTALMWDLVSTKLKPVVGNGAVEAQLMIIADVPNKRDAERGLSFCLGNGHRSTVQDCLAQQDITTLHCWYTHVVKIMPEKRRRPTYEEIENNLPLLLKEIAIIRPKLILCLGEAATTLAMHGFQLDESLRGNPVEVVYVEEPQSAFRTERAVNGKVTTAVRFGRFELVCRLHSMPSIDAFLCMRDASKAYDAWLEDWAVVRELLLLPPIPFTNAADILAQHYDSKGFDTLDAVAAHCGVEFSTPAQTFIERSYLFEIPLGEDYVGEHVGPRKGVRICVQLASFIESQNEFRFFCRTYEGYSVLLHVREPEFEIWIDHGSLNPVVDAHGVVNFKLYPIEVVEEQIRRWLISALEGSWRYENVDEDQLWQMLGVQVEYTWQRSAFFYRPARTRFLRVRFKRYDILWTLKSALSFIYPECEFYETKVGPVEQLFYRQNIYSYGWIRMEPSHIFEVDRESICDLEFGCNAANLKGKNPNTGQAKSSVDQYQSLVRFAALDGEMLNQGNGGMPTPESDPIVCLCVYLSDTNSPCKTILFESLRSPKKPQEVYSTGRTNYRDAVAFVVGPHQALTADVFGPQYLPYAPILPSTPPEKWCNPATVPFLRDIYNWEQFLEQCRTWIGYVGTYRARLILRSAKLQSLLLNPDYFEWPESYQAWRRRMKAIFATWHTRLPDSALELEITQPPTDASAEELGSIQTNWAVFHPQKRTFFFRCEEDMLAGFVEYCRQADVDVFSGHNVSSFDLTYIVRRIRVLGIRWDWYWEDRGSMFLSLGKGLFDERNRHTSLSGDRIETKTQETRASGLRVFTIITIPGRDIFDTLHYAQKDIPELDGYTLSQVAKKAVGDTKHDVPWSAIPSLFLNLSKKLTDYCMQDTELCERIMNALNTTNYVISMCRIIGCMSIGQFYTTGVQIKILNLLLRWLKQSGLSKVFPDFNPFSEGDAMDYADEDDAEIDEEVELNAEDGTKAKPRASGYVGATVLEVVRGFFRKPIPTLDFSSLYPSIMDELNLSLNTMGFLAWFEYLGIDRSRLYTSGEKHRNPFNAGAPEPLYFIQRQKLTREEAEALPACDDQPAGIAQCIYNAEDKTWTPKLEMGDLVWTGRMCRDARVAIRKEQGQYPSTHPRYKVLDSQQNAVKVIANSHYGFTGVASGRGACKPLGATVTHRGRQMINQVKDDMEKYFNATVIGGDTDSVFLMFPEVNEVQDLLKPVTRRKNAADPDSALVTLPYIQHCVNHVNARVKYPHKIVFEKASGTTGSYQKKKQDAANYMPATDPVTGEMTFENSKPKIAAKGTEGKRRSTAPYAKVIIDKFVELLWTDPKADLEQLKRKAEAYVRGKVEDMRAGNYDYSQMILSRYYARDEADYANADAPVLVINRKKRSRGEEPHPLGSRIPMVVVDTGNPKAKFFEKVEVPDYALEHKIPLDIEYYIDKHLKQPLKRKCDVIDPTMIARMFPPAPIRAPRLRADDPLNGFIYIQNKCLICKKQSKQEHVCNECVQQYSLDQIIERLTADEKEASEKLDRQKAICYACMGMDEPGEIVCANVHCKEYPVRKDMEFSLRRQKNDNKELREQWGFNDW